MLSSDYLDCALVSRKMLFFSGTAGSHMKEYACLYVDEDSLKNFIQESRIDTTSRLLVFMFSSGIPPENSVEAASVIKTLLPYSEIAGASTLAFVFRGRSCSGQIFLRIVSFEKSRFEVRFIPHMQAAPADIALDIVGNMCDQTTRAAIIQISGVEMELNSFLDEFNKLVPNISVVGGPVNTVQSVNEGFVFDEKGYYEHHFMIITFSGADLHVFSFPLNNVEPIGDFYEITDARGCNVREISGSPVKDFVNSILGIDITSSDEYTKLLDRFPLVLPDRNNSTRNLIYVKDSGEFFTPPWCPLKVGERIRTSFMSTRISYHHYSTMIDELNLFPCQVLWGYCCLLRPSLYPGMHAQIIDFFRPLDLSVSYVSSEFASDADRNELYTGTISYIGFTEDMNAEVTQLDKSMLKPILTDDMGATDVYKYVLLHQSEEVLAAKQELLKRIMEQEKKATASLFIDKNTGMPNAEKFAYDAVKLGFNKLTLVVIEKSIQLSNYFGNSEYITYYRENVKLFVDYLTEQHFLLADDPDASRLHIYCNDLSSFIIAAGAAISSDQFIELMRRLFLKFNKHYTHNEVVCMNNFFIVMDQNEELLEKAKLLLSDKKNELKRFVVYDESHEDTENFEESLAALSVVNYAIEHDGIEPYFQPIYDNSCGRTYKFESLMRIKDSNGKLWYPNQFLPVAKEFRLYLQLSCAMINKVFDLFDGREESVSINLSAIDINSQMVTDMICARLAMLKDPSHFIFEILESDAFEDLNLLSDFIRRLRTYNVMIAIDDFGAGYSNLLEIVKLKPDIIKIDGEIIKHLLHDEVNRNIMDVIIFMAKRFSVDLVAEFAESKELQDFLESKGIRYSQGYYFSKPLPYDQIDAYLESEKRSREEPAASAK